MLFAAPPIILFVVVADVALPLNTLAVIALSPANVVTVPPSGMFVEPIVVENGTTTVAEFAKNSLPS